MFQEETLRAVTIVQVQSFPSKSREPERLTGELVTLPNREEDASSSGFEKPEVSRRLTVNFIFEHNLASRCVLN